MSTWRSALLASAAVIGLAILLVPGCGRGSETTDADRRIARQVHAVVQQNIAAQERGDARTYCATYTEDYLSEHLGGSYAACTKRFSGPTEKSALPGVRFFNSVTFNGTETRAGVHFKIGEGDELLYELELTDPPEGSPPGRRWLIYRVAPPVRD